MMQYFKACLLRIDLKLFELGFEVLHHIGEQFPLYCDLAAASQPFGLNVVTVGMFHGGPEILEGRMQLYLYIEVVFEFAKHFCG